MMVKFCNLRVFRTMVRTDQQQYLTSHILVRQFEECFNIFCLYNEIQWGSNNFGPYLQYRPKKNKKFHYEGWDTVIVTFILSCGGARNVHTSAWAFPIMKCPKLP